MIETRVGMTLTDCLPFKLSNELTKLHPPYEGVDELLPVQLNRYSCGGLVIGIAGHHCVGDGQSMNSACFAWAQVVRGLNVNPLPHHDRIAVTAPRTPPVSKFNHQTIEFREGGATHSASSSSSSSSILNLVVHFSP